MVDKNEIVVSYSITWDWDSITWDWDGPVAMQAVDYSSSHIQMII